MLCPGTSVNPYVHFLWLCRCLSPSSLWTATPGFLGLDSLWSPATISQVLAATGIPDSAAGSHIQQFVYCFHYKGTEFHKNHWDNWIYMYRARTEWERASSPLWVLHDQCELCHGQNQKRQLWLYHYNNNWHWCSALNFTEHLHIGIVIWFSPDELQKEYRLSWTRAPDKDTTVQCYNTRKMAGSDSKPRSPESMIIFT